MAQQVPIETSSVALGAFLKWARIAETGGQAKALIQAGRVKVNGQTERRRSRMLVAGDRVEVGAQTLEVIRT